jgi:hypothetical protein
MSTKTIFNRPTFGLEITGKMDTCEACAMGKAKQSQSQNMLTEYTHNRVSSLILDIAGIKTPSKGGKSFWVLFVDAYSGCVVSRLVKYKSELEEMGMEVLKILANDEVKI